MEPVIAVAAFAILIYFPFRRLPLYIGMLLGSVILFLSGGSLAGFDEIVIRAATNPTTVELALAVALISFMCSVMSTAGLMDRMTSGLNSLMRNTKLSLMVVPALVGGMPMAGGAAMSAPIVESLGNDLKIPKASVSAINLTFRHALYLVMPFRPQIILAASMAGVGVTSLALVNMPAVAVWLLVGYFWLFRLSGPDANAGQWGDRRKALFEFAVYGSPIIISLVLLLGARLSLPPALLAGTLAAVYLARREGRLSWSWHQWMDRVDKPLVLTMVCIMIFREVTTEVTIIRDWLFYLVDMGIPLWVTAVVIAGALAYLTGVIHTPIAIVFPVVMPLVEPGLSLAYAALIYVISFVLYFVSPLHLCQILTNQMVGADLGDVYREYLPVLLPVIGTSFLVFWLMM